ncbi:hypothetical protein M408DRAFT_124239 [Serendipita vermifera MAFF 305830]|uniref:Uncharacterized protein n=1 Tax=Serendipita vermifera MAFF 305830 TaxID=933852 RepID=A0A0C3A7Y8_SERVB|nr:hypothetical protein M408DRAFT_124239 [Serendipita vermifera MAFF 305830]
MNLKDWMHGYFNVLLTGGVIGFLPILNYGSPTIKFAIILKVLQPKKVICLATTEDFSRSDVSGFQTSAEMKLGDQWVCGLLHHWSAEWEG